MELPHRATLVLLFICCTTINGNYNSLETYLI